MNSASNIAALNKTSIKLNKIINMMIYIYCIELPSGIYIIPTQIIFCSISIYFSNSNPMENTDHFPTIVIEHIIVFSYLDPDSS